MESSQRPEFDLQFALLCAGYNIPPTPVRQQAYFTGLAKMTLAQFIRVVEQAISEEGPDDFPTSKGIWKLHHQLRNRRAAGPSKPEEPPGDPRDHLLFYANRMFLRHVMTRGGLGSTDGQGSAELLAGRRFVRGHIDWWAGPVREGDPDATQAEFIRQFSVGLNRISPITEATQREWYERQRDPRAQMPFPPYMARELEPRYQAIKASPAQLVLTG